jgi:uncharacterized protein DUF3500
LPDQVVDLVHDLIALAHSSAGTTLIEEAMGVERERRRAVTGTPPDGDRYWWRVIGDPRSGAPWGWRLNGHHVAIHLMVREDVITLTPHFIGSEPAHIVTGPLAGHRILGPEEELARVLLTGLTADQRRRAVTLTQAPDDILTGSDPVAEPSKLPTGIPWPSLTGTQQDHLRRLVDRYFGRFPAETASTYWVEAMTDPDTIEFAWAGSDQPGRPHYYCVKTYTFLIEYDNTQDDANHAHSVLRHLRDDFGGDALREHIHQHHRR